MYLLTIENVFTQPNGHEFSERIAKKFETREELEKFASSFVRNSTQLDGTEVKSFLRGYFTPTIEFPIEKVG